MFAGLVARPARALGRGPLHRIAASSTTRHAWSLAAMQEEPAGVASEFNFLTADPKLTEKLAAKKGFIIDMDGVIYHRDHLLDGAKEFVEWLQAEKKEFLFLTNSSERAPRELKEKLQRMGIKVTENRFYTSALATASFLSSQKPNGSAYVIGEPGLMVALYNEGYVMNETNPDFVVVGETRNYNFEKIEKAANLVQMGARLIGTNCDVTDRIGDALIPACGSLIAPIEMTAGVKAYFVGKPNPVILRKALNYIQCSREESVIVGDRLDTDIVAGVQTEIDTVLVLSGVSTVHDMKRFAYRPSMVAAGVGEIAHQLKALRRGAAPA